MKKRAKNTGKMSGRKKLDTVGVAGSIPVEPTILQIPPHIQTIEIPADFTVIPAVEWNNGLPRFYRVLTRNYPKRRERGVNGSRSKKSA